MRRLVALGLALGLLLAACGDDDDDDDAGADTGSGDAASGEEGEYVDAIATAILEDADADTEPNPLAGNEEVARCAAEGFVEVLGVDGLEDLGLTLELIQSGEDDLLDDVVFSEDQSEDLADTLFDCVPTEIWAAAFEGAGDEETVDCLVEGFTEAGTFEESLAQSLQGNEDYEPDADVSNAVLEECGVR
jgi:hypothetical protein